MTGCQAINNIFFPEICSSCGEINEGFLCENCRRSIAEIKYVTCYFCGTPFISGRQRLPLKRSTDALTQRKAFSKKEIPNSSHVPGNINNKEKNAARCPACRERAYNFFRLRSFGLYSGVLKKLIIKFKYSKIYTLAPVLGSFLIKAYMDNYNEEKIDYVDTVPDFIGLKGGPSRCGLRAENHMQILAGMFSKETGIPYRCNIIKIRKTLRQQDLGMYERKVNLEGVFKAADTLRVDKKNILLIDDVWTTGNTLNEISGVLKKCGAKKIYLLTIARAI